MAPSNLPSVFNATSNDIGMLLAAQAHLGSKNLQVHMEPYLWKTRPDGINVINISKTWYENKLPIVKAFRAIMVIAEWVHSIFGYRIWLHSAKSRLTGKS